MGWGGVSWADWHSGAKVAVDGKEPAAVVEALYNPGVVTRGRPGLFQGCQPLTPDDRPGPTLSSDSRDRPVSETYIPSPAVRLFDIGLF
jgi:hypothetical protein